MDRATASERYSSTRWQGPERPIGLTLRRAGLSPSRRYLACELWSGRGRMMRRFMSVRVPRHGVALFRLTRHLS